MKRTILLCVGAAIALPMFFVPRVAAAEDVIFGKIAAPDVTAPGGGSYEYVYSGSLDHDRSVFQATTTDYVEGLFADDAGQVTVVADTETLVPGSVIHFSGFGGHAQDDGGTAFFGHYPEWCDMGPCGGIYLATSDGMSRIADTNGTVPGRNQAFEYLGEPAIEGDTVAFRGGTVIDYNYRYGVYAKLAGQLVTVADWETPTPQGSGYLDLYDTYGGGIGVHDGDVYFHAVNTGNYYDGFYAWDPDSGTYTVIRDSTTQVPGTQSYFDWTTGDVFRNGTYAFVGYYWADDYKEGVFADFGDGLEMIVDADELTADWYSYDVQFQHLAVSADTVAFTAADYWTYYDNRLFLYRHSDHSLRSIIGSGDVLDGRVVNLVELQHYGASDDAIAFVVEFRDTWQRELYVASLHTPRHDLLAIPDVDGNGYDDFVLLRQQSTDHTYLLQLRDSFTGGMPAMIPVGDFPVYDIALVETPGQDPALAVYGKRANGRLIVKMFSLTDGSFLRTHQLWLDMEPIAMTVLPDMNGNGTLEIAVMAETSQPFIRVKILDSETGAELNVISHGKSLRPVAIFAIDDLNASGVPEVVVMGVVRSTAKVRIIVQEAGDGTILSDFFAGYEDKAPVLDAMLIDDISGNGAPEIVLARSRPALGKATYEARDLLSGLNVTEKTWVTDSRPLRVTGIEDLTADGTAEIGLLMVAPEGDTQVRIYDLITNALVDSMDMLALGNGRGLMTTPDIDASSSEELVVLGEHFGADLLEIRDCADGDPLRYYFVP